MNHLIFAVTTASLALVVYHHLIYPAILLAWDRLVRADAPDVPGHARAAAAAPPGRLPSVAILVPAYNEAAVIADKVRNLAALDYPPDRLQVRIACDGCTDRTAALARAAHAEPECRHLRLQVLEFPANRGKLCILNALIPSLEAEVVALSDASALISVDALRIAAHHFADPRVGVVAGTYRLLHPGSTGEGLYWRFQNRLRRAEANIGSPIGAHGALYFLRRRLFCPLPADTINDDFVLPMAIVALGHLARYDDRIRAVELERASAAQDHRRRRRIAAGNMQQLLRLRSLLHPRFRGTAFAFASGKGLRAVMPFLLLAGFAGSLVLARTSPPMALLAAGQTSAAVLYAIGRLLPVDRRRRPLAAACYAVDGYLAALIGTSRYLLGLDRRGWTGAAARPDIQSAIYPVHPAVRRGKRIFDVAAAAVLLVAALPFFALIALAIVIDSPGPVLFRQLRIGEVGKEGARLFQIIKFRSMHENAEAVSGEVWAAEADPRATRVGAFLRRTRLDELPQLINVLRGEMALIGPRPERPRFFGTLDQAIPYYGERAYGVLPGISGYAQVNSPADQCIDHVRIKLYFDHAYALALSRPRAWLRLDLAIAVRTVGIMLFGPRFLRPLPNCLLAAHTPAAAPVPWCAAAETPACRQPAGVR